MAPINTRNKAQLTTSRAGWLRRRGAARAECNRAMRAVRAARGKWAKAQAMVAKRTRQINALAAPVGAAVAIKWATAQVGTRETSYNDSPKIHAWQREIAGGDSYLDRAPYCGIGCGVALRRAGVPVTSRVASVAFIEDDARLGRNGFTRLVPPTQARPGDLVILFGRGVHVELVVSVDAARRVLHTIGFNTSPGASGSQSNGEGVWPRARSFADVHAIARPAYPAARGAS